MGDALRSATLVYDSGAGLGHRRRMESLAQALESHDVGCQLRPTGDRVADELVVVDSYEARADDRTSFDGDTVAAIDDCERDLAVDLLVDPAPGASPDSHRSAARALLGPRYALVGPDIHTLKATPPATEVRRILVSTGADGSQAVDLGRRLTEVVPAGVSLRVVMWTPAADPVPAPLEPVRSDRGLGDELAHADLVVTAGGVTMLEALALGRPVVALVLYENQRRQAEGAAAAGAVVLADAATAPGRVAELLEDATRRATLAATAGRLVDGYGADRVAAELVRGG